MMVVRHYSWLQFVTSILDMFPLGFMAWLSIKYALLLVIIVLATLYAFSHQYLDLNNLANKLAKSSILNDQLQLSRQSNNSKQPINNNTKYAIHPRRLQRRLWHFNKEHWRITGYILTGRDIWSPIFVMFIMSNMPFNIYLLTFIYYRTLSSTIDKIFIIGVLLAQLTCSLFALMPIGITATAAHGSAKYYPRLQHAIQGDASLKWKFLVRYEIVNSDDKIGYKAGPFGVVTMKILFEFIFMYTGYLMFAADMINSA